MKNYIITTDRLGFKYYTEADIEPLTLLGNNPIMRKNIGDTFPYPYTIDDAKRRVYSGSKKSKTKEYFAIFLLDGEVLIGGCGLEQGDQRYSKNLHVGYRFGELFRGQGFATETLKKLIEYGFTHFDVTKMRSGVFGYNPASARVMEKCGFTKEGTLEKHIFYEGEWYDERLYGLQKNK